MVASSDFSVPNIATKPRARCDYSEAVEARMANFPLKCNIHQIVPFGLFLNPSLLVVKIADDSIGSTRGLNLLTVTLTMPCVDMIGVTQSAIVALT